MLNVKTKTNNFFTQHAVNLYFSRNSMNNLLSYCGLTDARMRAYEKDLPVHVRGHFSTYTWTTLGIF